MLLFEIMTFHNWLVYILEQNHSETKEQKFFNLMFLLFRAQWVATTEEGGGEEEEEEEDDNDDLVVIKD